MKMTKKKNKFWTLVFSAIPGAGQMYMGFMKRGLSQMLVFFGICALATLTNVGPLLFLSVVSWFYSFFDTWNIWSLSSEDFANLQDDYAFLSESESARKTGHNSGILYLLLNKYRKITATCLIVIGGCSVLDYISDWISWLLPDYCYNPFSYLFDYRMPEILFSIGIIFIGIMLIRGKKEQLDDLEAGADSPMSADPKVMSKAETETETSVQPALPAPEETSDENEESKEMKL